MSRHYDVIIIGGGIVGLAHAWMAAQRGLRLLLIERSPYAQGASIRNFGMLWPIGQPPGSLHAIAMRSRELWLELHAAGVVQVHQCGSIHAAHRPDELAVLEEFCQRSGLDVSMISASEAVRRAPLVNSHNLLGGMWSPSEMRVNPRTASSQIAKWLNERHAVECMFDTAITKVDEHTAYASSGEFWTADRIVFCGGSDLQTLFPDVLQSTGLRLCKLQMLKAKQDFGPSSMPHVASGLTLRHYKSFDICPSLPLLKSRIAQESPELDRYGIHVMASAFDGGDVLLGDSHEYDDEITPFDKAEIDSLMLRELRKVIHLDDWTITERWHGIYAKHATKPVIECEVRRGVHLFLGTGGAGMTMSFGLVENAWKRWIGESDS